MSGPPVLLAFQQVQTFTLVLHELSTNALKHGALRPGPGRVEIAWAMEGETPSRSVQFRWRETGVEDMRPPEHRGFGTIMIERASGFARNTRSEMRYDGQGVDWRITMALPEAGRLAALRAFGAGHAEIPSSFGRPLQSASRSRATSRPRVPGPTCRSRDPPRRLRESRQGRFGRILRAAQLHASDAA